MIVVVAVVIFFLVTLMRGHYANLQAEKDIADMDIRWDRYMQEREEHERKMEALEMQKLAEIGY